MAEGLIGKACPKCGYKRTATDNAPDWQCPKCGVAYAKAAAAAAGGGTPASRPAAANPYSAPTANVAASGGAARPEAPSGPVESVVAALKGYVDFSGRATRSEYWWFFLFWIIAILVTGFVSEVAAGLVVLALLLPNLAVSVRRLHDIGKSGWLYLINLVPIVGALIVLFWALQPSDGDNDYGPAAG